MHYHVEVRGYMCNRQLVCVDLFLTVIGLGQNHLHFLKPIGSISCIVHAFGVRKP